MRIYETTFIVNPQSDDSTIESKVKAVSDLITKRGGKIIYENRIGTRRLAYAIRRFTQGYYTSLIFESESLVLPELEKMYKFDEAYLRYLTVIYEGDVKKLIEPEEDETAASEGGKKESRPADREHRRGRREEAGARNEAAEKKEPPVAEEKKEVEEKPVEESPATVEETKEAPEVAETTEVTETEEKTKLTSPEDEEL